MEIDAMVTPSIIALLPQGVMNEVTEFSLCGIEPGIWKCHGGKQSTFLGLNTSEYRL
jgi:hypothetical protein